MKYLVKDDEYVNMKEELIDLLNSDDRMNGNVLLEFIECHWDYELIKQFVENKENFFQWEVEKLMDENKKEFKFRKITLEDEKIK